MPQLRDLVAPELQPYRLRHSKAVDVEDSAAHAELSDVIDHLDALEADGFEMSGEIFRSPGVAFSKLQPGLREGARELSLFQQGSCCREQNCDMPATDALERFNPLSGDLGVR